MWREINLGSVNVSSAQSTPVAHNVATYPIDVNVYLECNAGGGDLGYAQFDRVKPSPQYITAAVDTGDLTLSVAGSVSIVGKSTHTLAAIAPSKWDVVVRLDL
jgi:hypothetical protein